MIEAEIDKRMDEEVKLLSSDAVVIEV